jgi:hypothetical protein
MTDDQLDQLLQAASTSLLDHITAAVASADAGDAAAGGAQLAGGAVRPRTPERGQGVPR